MDGISCVLSPIGSISGILAPVGEMQGTLMPWNGDNPSYTGEYTVTPSTEAHVLNTKDYVLLDNITINPIPSNYGLISWDGAVLTVR